MKTETDRMIAEAKAQLQSTTDDFMDFKYYVKWEDATFEASRWDWDRGELHIHFDITDMNTDIPAICKLYLMRGRNQIVKQAFPFDLTRDYRLWPSDNLEIKLDLRGIADIEEQMQSATWAWMQPA